MTFVFDDARRALTRAYEIMVEYDIPEYGSERNAYVELIELCNTISKEFGANHTHESVARSLTERFGEPIGMAPATVGVPDERDERDAGRPTRWGQMCDTCGGPLAPKGACELCEGENAIREAIEAPEPELRRIIAAMDPDQVSDEDYIDSETGEVYLEKGDFARTSELHLQRKVDREEKRHARHTAWAAEEASEEDEWETRRTQEHDDAEAAYDDAIKVFVSYWSREDLGDQDDLQGVATDGADTFFYTFPEWRQWAKKLGMSRDDMRSHLADLIYEKLLGHDEM
jgi:hypothetical protein